MMVTLTPAFLAAPPALLLAPPTTCPLRTTTSSLRSGLLCSAPELRSSALLLPVGSWGAPQPQTFCGRAGSGGEGEGTGQKQVNCNSSSDHPTLNEVLLRRAENITYSVSSTPRFIFKFSNLDLRGEVNLNMNLGVLELKMQEVHFNNKLSKAKFAGLGTTCLQIASSAVSTLMSTKKMAKYPDADLVRHGVLCYLC